MERRFDFTHALVSVAASLVLAMSAEAQDGRIQDVLAPQRQCADAAQVFLARQGSKQSTFSWYESAFNERLKTCFVLVFDSSPKNDFRTIDLYDAIGGRRYATYSGHDICDSIVVDPKKCQFDGGQLWFDGDDSRPPDFAVGFIGLLNRPGVGDKTTQGQFLQRVRSFMKQ